MHYDYLNKTQFITDGNFPLIRDNKIQTQNRPINNSIEWRQFYVAISVLMPNYNSHVQQHIWL